MEWFKSPITGGAQSGGRERALYCKGEGPSRMNSGPRLSSMAPGQHDLGRDISSNPWSHLSATTWLRELDALGRSFEGLVLLLTISSAVGKMSKSLSDTGFEADCLLGALSMSGPAQHYPCVLFLPLELKSSPSSLSQQPQDSPEREIWSPHDSRAGRSISIKDGM